MDAKLAPSSRRLTKSRFKVGLDCPTKLYYAGLNTYPDKRADDSFLAALADGGYQVGELAKHYYPGGHDIETLDVEDAIEQTSKLLKHENVIIYEPAIAIGNLLVRVDILVKTGTHFELIEVKAKSVDPSRPGFMNAKRTDITSAWKPYLMDVAFQKHVLSSVYPNHTINSFLMLVDKTTPAATDGLNSRFRIVQHGKSRRSVEVDAKLNSDDLDTKILSTVNVDEPVNWILEQANFDDRTFAQHVEFLDNVVQTGDRVQGKLGKRCRGCEFSATPEQRQQGLLSGYRECWQSTLGWVDADFEKATVFDIWDLRQADRLMAEDKLFLDKLTVEDLPVSASDNPGLSRTERQWLQINKSVLDDSEAYLDIAGLQAEMAQWQYPLHFIDFETIAPAIPFTRGLRPYETVAFQFSHHILNEDGRVEHAGQFIDTTPGINPSLNFLRALKEQLTQDNGTVFRFHNHENTVLNGLADQLQSIDMTDSTETAELIAFIRTLTHATARNTDQWVGARDMVDLHQLNVRYYYNPITQGANSLKALLPAILQSSLFLQDSYGKPNYGAANGIPSLNFKSMQWIVNKDGVVQDPYSLLSPLFNSPIDPQNVADSSNTPIADGGAAMTAYAKLQNVDMSKEERNALTEALLRYCELDTLAMVMVVQAWQDMIRQHAVLKAS